MVKIKLIAVVGPTASGKSALAVKLAHFFDGEIVSADSMQIYKGMPIASAVPTLKEREGIVHHLIEVLEPQQRCTVANYVVLAHKAIADIHARGKMPILVGGTGLYIDSLLQNLTFAEEKNDHSVRQALLKEANEKGTDVLYRRLSDIDPQTAMRLHPNDQKRIIRALEIFALTGNTPSMQNEASRKAASPYAPVLIGLRFCDRETLYNRINQRVDMMMAAGLVDEARISFLNSKEYPTASAAIGHKELFDYFSGKLTLNQAVENLKRSTRRYAKRQITWFGRNSNIHWIDVDKTIDVYGSAVEILQKY